MGCCANSMPADAPRKRETKSAPHNFQFRLADVKDAQVQVTYSKQRPKIKVRGSIMSNLANTASVSKMSLVENLLKVFPADKKKGNSLILALTQVTPEDPVVNRPHKYPEKHNSPTCSIHSPLSKAELGKKQQALEKWFRNSPNTPLGRMMAPGPETFGTSTQAVQEKPGKDLPQIFSKGFKQENGNTGSIEKPVFVIKRSMSSPNLQLETGPFSLMRRKPCGSSLTHVAKNTVQKMQRNEDADNRWHKSNVKRMLSIDPLRIPQNKKLLWAPPPRRFSPPKPIGKTDLQKIKTFAVTQGLYTTPGSPEPSRPVQSKTNLFPFVVRKKIKPKEESDLVKYRRIMTDQKSQAQKPRAVLLLNGQFLTMKR